MTKYRRLNSGDRYQIQAWLQSNQSIRFIAEKLNRSPSTISREVRKCQQNLYEADLAETETQLQLHKPRQSRRKILGKTEVYIRNKLKSDWSPEQVAGRMSLLKMKNKVSYMTIYRYLERDKAEKGVLWKRLRILRKQQKDRKAIGWKPRQFMPERVSIEKRPKIVEARRRLGDYERDTVLGKRGGPVLLTIVDRTSRLLKLAWIKKSTANNIHKATVSRLRHEPKHTITNDNGFEFSHHVRTSKALKTAIYFNRSFHAWERGTNENTNGLLRQYFPKKQPIGQLSRKHTNSIERLLNTRPRKILGYKTPLEVYKKLRS